MTKRTITILPGETVEIIGATSMEFYSIAQVCEITKQTRKTVTKKLKAQNLLTYFGTKPKVSQEHLNQFLTNTKPCQI